MPQRRARVGQVRDCPRKVALQTTEDWYEHPADFWSRFRGTLAHMAPHLTHMGVHDHGFNTVSTYGALWRLAREGRLEAGEWELHLYELALKVSGAVQARRPNPSFGDIRVFGTDGEYTAFASVAGGPSRSTGSGAKMEAPTPTSISAAPSGPSPGTACVASCQSGQARQALSARTVRSAAGMASLRDIWGPFVDVGCTAQPLPRLTHFTHATGLSSRDVGHSRRTLRP